MGIIVLLISIVCFLGFAALARRRRDDVAIAILVSELIGLAVLTYLHPGGDAPRWVWIYGTGGASLDGDVRYGVLLTAQSLYILSSLAGWIAGRMWRQRRAR